MSSLANDRYDVLSMLMTIGFMTTSFRSDSTNLTSNDSDETDPDMPSLVSDDSDDDTPPLLTSPLRRAFQEFMFEMYHWSEVD